MACERVELESGLTIYLNWGVSHDSHDVWNIMNWMIIFICQSLSLEQMFMSNQYILLGAPSEPFPGQLSIFYCIFVCFVHLKIEQNRTLLALNQEIKEI